MGGLVTEAALGHDDPAVSHLVLSQDATIFAAFDLDGHRVVFTWFRDSGIDRASGEVDGSPLGAIEKLDTANPRMLPDGAQTEWLSRHGREQRIVAAVHEHWERRSLLLHHSGCGS